jgi:hypothetical protein
MLYVGDFSGTIYCATSYRESNEHPGVFVAGDGENSRHDVTAQAIAAVVKIAKTHTLSDGKGNIVKVELVPKDDAHTPTADADLLRRASEVPYLRDNYRRAADDLEDYAGEIDAAIREKEAVQ